MSQQLQRRRIHYTPELKLKLMKLCVENGARYIETVPMDDFWRYIRALFISANGLRDGGDRDGSDRDGGSIRRKVASIVADRKAELVQQASQPGGGGGGGGDSGSGSGSGSVTVAAPTEMEQAIDTWIEWVDRRSDGKQEKGGQQNLTMTPLEKRTFQEIDLTDTESTTRDKRRQTGEQQPWASGEGEREREWEREGREMQQHWDCLYSNDKQSLALMRDILNAITTTNSNMTKAADTSITTSTVTLTATTSAATSATTTTTSAITSETASATSSSSSATSSATSSGPNSNSVTASGSTSETAPATEARFAMLESQIDVIRQSQQQILSLLSEMRKDKAE